VYTHYRRGLSGSVHRHQNQAASKPGTPAIPVNQVYCDQGIQHIERSFPERDSKFIFTKRMNLQGKAIAFIIREGRILRNPISSANMTNLLLNISDRLRGR
jgi:hypothetical protein